MNIKYSALGAALILAACGSTPPPYSNNPNVDNGVGFGSPQQYVAQQRAARDAELMAMRQSAPAAATTEEQAIAAETMTALNVPSDRAPASNTPEPAITPFQTIAGTGNPEISDEQDFEAVASRQTIESDADRLAANRAELVNIQPVAVPERSGSGGPNIVAYALQTNHPVGTVMHRRSGRTTAERTSRVCQSYGTDDQAQSAFLANGGPERDRKGVDPDGDGYACSWNPLPFRMARGG